MVTRWGMSDVLGMVQLAPPDNPSLAAIGASAKPFGEATARTIDAEVHRIIAECHDEARQRLSDHREQLDVLAKALLEKETLDEQEILNVTGLSPTAGRT
jgi:cell division protease FtsH